MANKRQQETVNLTHVDEKLTGLEQPSSTRIQLPERTMMHIFLRPFFPVAAMRMWKPAKI